MRNTKDEGRDRSHTSNKQKIAERMPGQCVFCCFGSFGFFSFWFLVLCFFFGFLICRCPGCPHTVPITHSNRNTKTRRPNDQQTKKQRIKHTRPKKQKHQSSSGIFGCLVFWVFGLRLGALKPHERRPTKRHTHTHINAVPAFSADRFLFFCF